MVLSVPRLDRRSAGRGVASRVGRYSDDLLAVEEAAFAAMEGAGASVPSLLKAALTGYSTVEAKAVSAFDVDVTLQAAMARADTDPLISILKRVSSADGLSLPGNSGRGVWWRQSSTVKGQARSTIIGLTNAVRESAMRAMNQAHTGRSNS
jgi:hypothetical protein